MINLNIMLMTTIIYAYMILLLLIRRGRLKIVQFLINGKHYNTEAVGKDGQTLLHLSMR